MNEQQLVAWLTLSFVPQLGGKRLFRLLSVDSPLNIVGYSSQQLQAIGLSAKRPIPYQIAPRRPGDVAQCYANSGHAKAVLGWQATRTLEDMVKDSWRWQSSNPNGYLEA